MMNLHEEDELRRRMQAALIESKREQLRDEFGMVEMGHTDPLPPEVELEWLEYMLRFEQQLAEANIVTVWERIGCPPWPPIDEMDANELPEAVEQMLDHLAAHQIAIDFCGTWPPAEAYRYLTEVLLTEEIEEISLAGSVAHFTPSTPAYDVEMWSEMFIRDLFSHDHMGVFCAIGTDSLEDTAGRSLTRGEIEHQLQGIWAQLPVVFHLAIEPLAIEIHEGETTEGWVTMGIEWQWLDEVQRLTSTLVLRPCPLDSGGWDVCRTSLLDDLGALLAKTDK